MPIKLMHDHTENEDKAYVTFEAIPELIKSLREKRGPKFLNDALHNLHSPDWEANLQRIIEEERTDYLNHILDSPDYATEVKNTVIYNLRRVGLANKESIPYLLSALQQVKNGHLSTTQGYVEAALVALNNINDSSVVPELNRMSTDPSLKLITRAQIIDCLGKFGDISTLPYIKSIMQEANELISIKKGRRTIISPANEVYSACIKALSLIGKTHKKAVPLLLLTLDHNPTERAIEELRHLIKQHEKAEYQMQFDEKLMYLVNHNTHKSVALRALRESNLSETKAFVEEVSD